MAFVTIVAIFNYDFFVDVLTDSHFQKRTYIAGFGIDQAICAFWIFVLPKVI